MLLGDFLGAATHLRSLLPGEGHFRDVTDRNVVHLWAELALAQGEPNEALRWVQYLLVPQREGLGNASALHVQGEALADRRQPEPGGTPLLGRLDSLLHAKRAGFWWHGAWKPGDRPTTARGVARRRLEQFPTGDHDPF